MLIASIARYLLRAALPARLRDAVLGDLEAEMDARIASGHTNADAARWMTAQAFGSLPWAVRLRFMRDASEPSTWTWRGAVQSFWQDVRYWLRSTRRSPLTTCAAIATLSLGVGVTTAIFSVMHAALLRALPLDEPDRIVRIYETYQTVITRGAMNPSNFDFIQQNAASFEEVAGMRGTARTLTGAGDPARIIVQAVTPEFFDALGIAPTVGRRLDATDGADGTAAVLLSHKLWTARLGGDPNITTRTVVLNGVARPVAGVMPAGFEFPDRSDAWEILELSAQERASSRAWFLGCVARLKQGVSAEDAQAEVAALSAALREREPRRQKDRGATVVGLHADMTASIASGLRMLQIAAGLVLLVAVVNVANLLLAQSTGRGRELGIRTAVGASRGRIVRQLLTESLLVGVAGAAGGMLIAVWGVRSLVALSPIALPPWMQPTVNVTMLAFALCAGVAASLLFGMAPVLGGAVAPARSGGAVEGRLSARRIRAGLVAVQIALAVVLLSGAGLLVRSFAALMSQELGFVPERILTAQTTLPAIRYDTPEKRLAFWRGLFERLESLPEVDAVGASTALPFSRWEWQIDFKVVGREHVANSGTGHRTVHPGYFSTLGIPILAGRGFSPTDGLAGQQAVIVNDLFARTHLAGLSPLGQRIVVGPSTTPSVVVGVVGSTRHFALHRDPQPEIYQPLLERSPQTLVLAVRTRGDADRLAASVRSVVQDVDRDLPVEQLMTMEAMIGRSVAERRFQLALMGTFGLLALIMAIIGVYSVMAHAVGQRRREIGIRMALGAAPAQVQRLVLKNGGTVILAGLALGLATALGSARVIASFLFGVTPHDPVTFATVAVLLGAAALLAAYLPATRAKAVDPVQALRN